MGIPVIDLSPFATGEPLATSPSPEATATAARIDELCRELGFLCVTGHGMRPSTKANLLAQMRRFFAEPVEEKLTISIADSDCHRGYIAIGAENLEGALGDDDSIGSVMDGDLKETIDSGRDQGPDHPEVLAGTPLHGPNRLPDLPGFREAWATYFDEAVEAALRMQRGLAMALGLPPDFFEATDGETMYHLRMIHYPPADRVSAEPGQLGCGTHTDYGTITVLGDDGVGGLQVRQRSGEWIDVEVPPEHLVINLGDLMAIWTNDRYVSNPHRVANPPHVDRYSIPLFVTPSFHQLIEVLPTCVAEGETPRHDPMLAGPYLMSRFDGTHSYRNPELEAHNQGLATLG